MARRYRVERLLRPDDGAAEIELKRGKIDDAIVHLEHAIPLAKKKREKVRWAFVLAQPGSKDSAVPSRPYMTPRTVWLTASSGTPA